MRTIRPLFSRILLTLILLSQSPSAFAQSNQCTSNRNEIEAQVRNVTYSFSERISAIKRERVRENLSITANYSGAEKSSVRREHNRKYDAMLNDLELQRNLSVADLKSRIFEVCEEVPTSTKSPEGEDSGTRGAKLVETLSQLASMHESGILSDEEFQAAKRRALGI